MKVDDKLPIPIVKAVSGLQNTLALFYENPYLRDFEAKAIESLSLDGLSYIILDRTCFFPEGGGQLGDIGSLVCPEGSFKVIDTQAVDDVVIHVLAEKDVELEEGEPIQGSIDWNVRYERMKQHTASHLIFSSVKQVLDIEDLTYMGVQIKEDTSRIDINYGEPISKSQIHEIERLSNRVCMENRKINTWLTSREEAEETYGGQLGLTEITPSGEVRVVEVEGWDVALCSGTHVTSTSEVGLIVVLDRFRLKKGVERIEFTAGKYAYNHYDKSMGILRDIAQKLKTSMKEAPVRLKHLLRERDELKKELTALQEHRVESQFLELRSQAEHLGDLKLLQRRLPNTDLQSLKRISAKLVDREPRLIAFLGSETDTSSIIVGAAGEAALNEGVDMVAPIKEVAEIIQGGGGGNPGLAQAGGRAPDKTDEALRLYTKKVIDSLPKKRIITKE